MASSGKKGKKHKGKTMPLTDFLADGTSGPGPGKVIVHCSRTWADEVENEDDGCYSSSRSKQPVILPTAPRETRSARNVDEENIPRNPPFKAYIVNLHYDTNENDIHELFESMKIVDVQLPRDDRGNGRLKGFGYIEFETRENLIAALIMDDTSIKGRRMRIEVSINNDAGNNERRYGGGSDRRYENREYDPERTQGNWRSGPRVEPPLPNKPAMFGRNTGNIQKDRGAFTRSNMVGPLTRDGEECFTRDNMDASRERCPFTRGNMDQMVRTNQDGFMNREFRGSGFDGRYGNRARYRENMPRGRGYNNAYEERDRHFGNRDRYGGYPSDDRVHHQNNNNYRNPPETDTPAEIKTRPKLCLAQRTVAKTEDVAYPVSVQSAIFGGARPVDTAAREREVEETRIRKEQSHGMRRLTTEGDETQTIPASLDGKSIDSGDHIIGIVEERISLDLEENVECKETNDNQCRYETPEIEILSRAQDELLSISGGADPVDTTAKDLQVEERVVKSEEVTHKPGSERSSIFGGATPVDTSTREREVEERLAKSEKVIVPYVKPGKEVEALVMEHLQKPPESSTIFGGATPVDTSAREREVEERLAREREEKRARGEWRLAREKRGGKYGGMDASRQSIVYGASRPPIDAASARDREVDARLVKEGRRKGIYNVDEPPMKRDEQQQQQQQPLVAKKFEIAQPPVENVWVRRAAQQAANQERGQLFAPPIAFKKTHGL